MQDLLIDIGMYVVYALFIGGILALLFFSIRQLVLNIKGNTTTLIGIGVLIIIFLVSMLFSSGVDVSETLFEKVGTDYSLSRVIGAGLISVYILFVLVVVSIIAVELAKPFKK